MKRLVAITVLIASIALALPVFGCSGSEVTVNNNAGADDASYSKTDEERIADTLSDAEMLADASDYNAALLLVDRALDSYPDSKALKNKRSEYRKALKASKKSSTKSNESSKSNDSRTSAALQPFYGIWCHASKDYSGAESGANELRRKGFSASVYVTTDWSGLNSEKWYVVSAGEYGSSDSAQASLSSVQSVYPDAYVKYTGNYIGS